MQRTLGTLLMTAAVAVTDGCGSASSGGATGPTGPTPGPVHGAHVRLVSMTGGGGRVSSRATLLDTPAHVRGFIAQFRPPAMRNQIRAAVGKARTTGQIVYGAVVAVGCDRPPGAVVALDGSGDVAITPRDVASPLQECLAAVTTVAIASVPGAD